MGVVGRGPEEGLLAWPGLGGKVDEGGWMAPHCRELSPLGAEVTGPLTGLAGGQQKVTAPNPDLGTAVPLPLTQVHRLLGTHLCSLGGVVGWTFGTLWHLALRR